MFHTAFHMVVFSNTLLLCLQGFSQTREMSVLRVLTTSWSSSLGARTLPVCVSTGRILWVSRVT